MLGIHKRAIELVIDFISSMQPLGCLLDSPDEAGWSLLFHAIKCGDLGLVAKLLSAGASVTLIDHMNRTPLSWVF